MIAELEADTQDISTSIGIDGSRFECGEFSSTATLYLKVCIVYWKYMGVIVRGENINGLKWASCKTGYLLPFDPILISYGVFNYIIRTSDLLPHLH